MTAEQIVKLRCKDCDWTAEADIFNAKDTVADHTHHWTEEAGYHNLLHVVEGTTVTVFRDDY
jgi:hypothetical protein